MAGALAFLEGHTASAGYRPDIDGLRAVAVGAVIFYHWGVDGVGGGLAGVDIFFVISGFLITRILYGELQSGSFSVRHFYERRIRRIFPALFLVMSVSAALAWWLVPPPDVVRVGHSLSAAALFVANFYFLGQGSYFSASAQQAPLLHLWSLGVEEQFYLVFPWLLLAGWVWLRGRHVMLLALLAGLSLAFAVWLSGYSASAAFFFSGARFWELLVGSLLAVTPGLRVGQRWMAHGLSLAGLALVALAISGRWAEAMPAGAQPLCACLGAALLIAAGEQHQGIGSRLLSLRPLVFIGLISYSLYLWHWPLLVYYRATQPAGNGVSALVMIATFLLAVASWRFVEQPFRRLPMPANRVFWLAAGVVLAALMVAGFFSITRGGLERFSPRAQWLYSFEGYEAGEAVREDRCFLTPRRLDTRHFDHAACLPQVAGKPSYLLAGDSHAAHLWFGLAQAMPEVTLQQATASGCRPLLGGPRVPECEPFLNDILEDRLPAIRPKAVVLAARWSEADIAPLRKTIALLLRSTDKVIVIGPSVEYREPLPRILAMAERTGDVSLVSLARVPRIAELDRLMSDGLAGSGAHYLSLYRMLCPPDRPDCVSVTPEEGVPLQFDYGHFTRDGSVYVGKRLREALLNGQGLH